MTPACRPRVILSLHATRTTLAALRRGEIACAVAAPGTENRRWAKPEQSSSNSLPGAGGCGGYQAEDLFSTTFKAFLALDPSANQEGGL